MNQQDGRVAIVTGASREIGAAVAERLASGGFSVVVNYAESAGPAQEVVAKIEKAAKAGGRAMAVRADVSDGASVRILFDATERKFGGVDLLMNNAGIMNLSSIARANGGII
jgi:3-oxoacyl-[acyl-carrier protein] reductase